jgi:hypothetical protein
MSEPNYFRTWVDLESERNSLMGKRAELEADLNEVNNKISHLTETLRHLAPLAGVHGEHGGVIGLGITDAIRTILRSASHREEDEWMTASDVKKDLNEKGFDFSGISHPMASIYKILSRLVDDYGEAEKEKIELEEGGGRIAFRWKVPEITDEDIPF